MEVEQSTPQQVPAKRKAVDSAFSSNSTLSELSDDESQSRAAPSDTPATTAMEEVEEATKSPGQAVRRSARQSTTAPSAGKGRVKAEPKATNGTSGTSGANSDRRQSARIKKLKTN
jgi:hypothetical protein